MISQSRLKYRKLLSLSFSYTDIQAKNFKEFQAKNLIPVTKMPTQVFLLQHCFESKIDRTSFTVVAAAIV